MLSESNLVAVRNKLSDFFKGSCDIFKAEEVTNERFITSSETALSAENVPCYLSFGQAAGEASENFNKIRQNVKLFLPFDTEVLENCSFIIRQGGKEYCFGVGGGIRFYPTHIEVFLKHSSPDFLPMERS